MGSEDKLFSAKRWTDIPKPIVIGHFESTSAEKKENEKKLEEIMRAYGVLGPNEHIRNEREINVEGNNKVKQSMSKEGIEEGDQ